MEADQARDDDHADRVEDLVESRPAERAEQELRDIDRDRNDVREARLRAGDARRLRWRDPAPDLIEQPGHDSRTHISIMPLRARRRSVQSRQKTNGSAG